ncbi:hypothetical protein QYE76_047326 [Lolium multiflorum]|uniref:Retrotransposon gag domain-containing protein n=1 Tax=Lolium multiflorum TaxID=4521 RepID=A0AAD8X1U9_LOLMU|nr:hypothetical protein QYE76_047326 [Lolium multiflorum]
MTPLLQRSSRCPTALPGCSPSTNACGSLLERRELVLEQVALVKAQVVALEDGLDRPAVFERLLLPRRLVRYEEETSIARGEEQLDVKMDVKLDMELDMKISHGRAREEREACARGEEEVQAGPEPGRPPRRAAARGRPPPEEALVPDGNRNLADFRLPTGDRTTDRTGRSTARSTGFQTGPVRVCLDQIYSGDHKIVNQENKDSADIINWREFEALRNEMRREFRAQDDELKGTVDEIKQTLDATNATVTGLADQVTDIQRNIADMLIAIENLTAQQQQEDDEDPELEDDAHNARGAPRGHRPRGWVPLGRNGRGQDEEDGLGKPKFSIPKFEGGADVEEYLTWELKIEKLWSLHPNYSEDKKIKLASSEFDGYALRWWDSLVRNRDEDGAQPIRTWRGMKEVMTSRFVPTNYMRNIFDKLTLLRQGVKTVDEYYMEMEMLMQRGRVRTCYGSWAFYTPRALYGAGTFDALRSLLYSA